MKDLVDIYDLPSEDDPSQEVPISHYVPLSALDPDGEYLSSEKISSLSPEERRAKMSDKSIDILWAILNDPKTDLLAKKQIASDLMKMEEKRTQKDVVKHYTLTFGEDYMKALGVAASEFSQATYIRSESPTPSHTSNDLPEEEMEIPEEP